MTVDQSNSTELGVLLIDDDPILSELLVLCLEQAGYSTTVAHDEPTALAALESDAQIGFVVCDFRLEGVQGPELITRLEQARPSIGSVLISGYGEATVSKRLGERTAFLQKPFEPDRLIDIIAASVQ